MKNALQWLRRNSVTDSAASELDNRFGLAIVDESQEPIDWFEVARFIADRIEAGPHS